MICELVQDVWDLLFITDCGEHNSFVNSDTFTSQQSQQNGHQNLFIILIVPCGLNVPLKLGLPARPLSSKITSKRKRFRGFQRACHLTQLFITTVNNLALRFTTLQAWMPTIQVDTVTTRDDLDLTPDTML